VAVEIRDNGKGLEEKVMKLRPGTMGVGIGGMRQRVEEFGGKLKLTSANPGTIVEVVIPVKEEARDRMLVPA
jgi:signal transduction histidine kinase